MPRLLRLKTGFPPRLVLLAGVLTSLLTLYTLYTRSQSAFLSSLTIWRQPGNPGHCTPKQWSTGQWTRHASPPGTPHNVSSVADVLAMAGFSGCASDREFAWHLAADDPAYWDHLPEATAYTWTPDPGCNVRPFDREALVRDLAERGGWLLIGDSVTENHFFSLSCLLHPHVRAMPNYTENPYFDRAWPQHLYLHPASPLLPTLRLPPGFDIAHTPLVTFRRSDLLLTAAQLRTLHAVADPARAAAPGFDLFGAGDAAWEVAPADALALFTAPLPRANYGTLVASTAGHWSARTFAGLRDPAARGDGPDAVLALFRDAAAVWARMAQRWLRAVPADPASGAGARTAGGRRRQVVVRAYLPGHDGCHDHYAPWTWYEQRDWDLSYNWAQIKEFNQVFEDVLAEGDYPDVHYLGIDGPGLLRPDAHVAGDCLHLMTGSGVIEGWTQYIWHYITREIPA